MNTNIQRKKMKLAESELMSDEICDKKVISS